MYAFKAAIAKLYGTNIHVNLNGFRFLINLGPHHTIIKYITVKNNVGTGESTSSHPFVLSSIDLKKKKKIVIDKYLEN